MINTSADFKQTLGNGSTDDEVFAAAKLRLGWT